MHQTMPPRFTAPPRWGPVPSPPGTWTWPALMEMALAQARLAAHLPSPTPAPRLPLPEVPVGAVLIDAHGQLLAQAHNETENSHDPTAHAEILALRRAAAKVGNHRLGGALLIVTLEPCLMCAAALREARLAGVVYGAADKVAGALCSRIEAFALFPGPAPWFMGGVQAEASAALLQAFFQTRRSTPSSTPCQKSCPCLH